jgi:dipeptide/tripeptide permease
MRLAARVARCRLSRHSGMRKILSLVGSFVVSSILGWAGSQYGLMTGFMLGTIGTGIGMYAGYKLAERLEA